MGFVSGEGVYAPSLGCIVGMSPNTGGLVAFTKIDVFFEGAGCTGSAYDLLSFNGGTPSPGLPFWCVLAQDNRVFRVAQPVRQVFATTNSRLTIGNTCQATVPQTFGNFVQLVDVTALTGQINAPFTFSEN